VAYEAERVEYSEQLARWVAATPPGTAVEMVWVRGETPHNARVVIGRSPHDTPPWALAVGAPRPAAAAAAPAATAGDRISDLERQVLQLNREIARLRSEAAQDSK